MIRIETKEQFDTVVAENDKVLVKFHATWCRPCVKMAPIVEEIDNERSDVVVVSVDVDEVVDVSSEYNVSSVPTLVFIRGHEEAGRLSGAFPKPRVVQMLGTV